MWTHIKSCNIIHTVHFINLDVYHWFTIWTIIYTYLVCHCQCSFCNHYHVTWIPAPTRISPPYSQATPTLTQWSFSIRQHNCSPMVFLLPPEPPTQPANKGFRPSVELLMLPLSQLHNTPLYYSQHIWQLSALPTLLSRSIFLPSGTCMY